MPLVTFAAVTVVAMIVVAYTVIKSHKLYKKQNGGIGVQKTGSGWVWKPTIGIWFIYAVYEFVGLFL